MTYSLASQIIDLSKIEKEYTTTIQTPRGSYEFPILNSSDRIISDLKGDEILEQALETLKALEKSAEPRPSDHKALIRQLISRSEFYKKVRTTDSQTYGAILEEAAKSLEEGSKTEGLLTKQKEFDSLLTRLSVETFNGSEIIIRKGDKILTCQFKKHDETDDMTEEKIAESIRSELLLFSETNKLGLSREQADYILQSQSTEITPGSSLYADKALESQPSYKSIVEIRPDSVKVKKCTVNSNGSDFCLIRTSESDITSLVTEASEPKKIVKSSLEIIRTVSLEPLSKELGETTSTKITRDRAADILIATFPNIDDKLNETLESQLGKKEIIKIKSAIIRSSKEKAAEFVKHIFPDIPQEYQEAIETTLKGEEIIQIKSDIIRSSKEKAAEFVKHIFPDIPQEYQEALKTSLSEEEIKQARLEKAYEIVKNSFPHDIPQEYQEALKTSLSEEEIKQARLEKAYEIVKNSFPHDIPQEYQEAVNENLEAAGIRQARREAAWEKAEKLVKSKDVRELKVSDIKRIAESIRSDYFQNANKLPYVDMVIHLAEKNNIKLSTGAKIIYSFERLKNWWNKRKNPERPFDNFIPKSTEIPIPKTESLAAVPAPATNPELQHSKTATSLRRNLSRSKSTTTLSSSKTTVPTPLRRSPSAPNLGRK
jgi:hypothetical protein